MDPGSMDAAWCLSGATIWFLPRYDGGVLNSDLTSFQGVEIHGLEDMHLPNTLCCNL